MSGEGGGGGNDISHVQGGTKNLVLLGGGGVEFNPCPGGVGGV